MSVILLTQSRSTRCLLFILNAFNISMHTSIHHVKHISDTTHFLYHNKRFSSTFFTLPSIFCFSRCSSIEHGTKYLIAARPFLHKSDERIRKVFATLA